MALTFIKQVRSEERAPWGYGLAWWDWKREFAVTMPVPFNVLARVLRDAWLYLSNAGEVAVNPRAAYHDGYMAGRDSMHDDLAQAGVVCRCDRNKRGQS